MVGEKLWHKLADAAKKAAENPEEVGYLLGKPAKGDGNTTNKADGEDDKASRRSALQDIVAVRAELCHNHNGEPFARMLVPNHELGLAEEGEQRWHREDDCHRERRLSAPAASGPHGVYGEAASRHLLEEVAFAIAAKARCQGKEQELFVRIAFCDGAVWLDLGDPEWRAVRITAEDWEVVATPPVAFRRPAGLLPLPTPVRGGTISELRPF